MADSAPPTTAQQTTARWWIGALLVALAWVGWDASQTLHHYAKASAAYGVAVRAPAGDPASLTGFADGRRNIVYPARWVDGQHWIIQAQRMLADREWRLRTVDD